MIREGDKIGTSPLPWFGVWYRYRWKLIRGGDGEVSDVPGFFATMSTPSRHLSVRNGDVPVERRL